MEAQTTLNEFFSTRKRGSEGVHPAKRRKVSDVENVEIAAVHLKRKKAKEASKVEVTSAKHRRSRRAKSSKSKDAFLRNTEVTSILPCAGFELSGKETEKAICETTSVFDDHAFEQAMNGNSSQRKRKMPASKVSSKNSEVVTTQVVIQGAKSGSDDRVIRKGSGMPLRRATKATSKDHVGSVGSSPENNAKEKGGGEHENEKSRKAEQHVEEESSVGQNADNTSSQKLSSPSKRHSVVKRSAGSLKLNPWISEQAKVVLFSRGQTAVAMSKKLNSETKKEQNIKIPGKKKATSEAQENLEKARKLLQTMRSLESTAAKPKNVTTSENCERLHQLASEKSNTAARLVLDLFGEGGGGYFAPGGVTQTLGKHFFHIPWRLGRVFFAPTFGTDDVV